MIYRPSGSCDCMDPRHGGMPHPRRDAPTLRLGLGWTPADEDASQRARREADYLRGEDPDLE